MKEQPGDDARVNHVLGAIKEVEDYIDGVTEKDFLLKSEKRFATTKQIEIIGEACNKITAALKTQHPEILWHQIIGFRNISVHEYHDIDMNVVWDIAREKLPVLKKQFVAIKKELKLQVEKQNEPALNQKSKTLLLKKKIGKKKSRKNRL